MLISFTPFRIIIHPSKINLSLQMHHVPGKELLSSYFPSVPIMPGFALEGLANRNSIPYAEEYNLGPLESLETVFRGTLRYKGFADLLSTMARCGLLSTAESNKITLKSWTELGEKAMRASGSTSSLSAQVEDDLVA